FIKSYGFHEYQGKKDVPHLLFVRDNAIASVLCLTSKDFDLTGVVANPGYGNIVFVHHPTNPSVAYVIFFTANSLKAFLNDKENENAIGLAPDAASQRTLYE